MYTRQALAALQATSRSLSPAKHLPARLASAEAVQLLGATQSAPAEPAEAVLELLRRKLVARFSNAAYDVQISRRDLSNAPWLLWHHQQPLANISGLLEAVYAQSIRSNSTRRNFIEAWVHDFSTEGPAIGKAGAAIRLLLTSTRDPRLEHWRIGDRVASVFDPKAGPCQFANWLLNGPQTVDEIFEMTGFADPFRSVGGFMRVVQQELLKLAEPKLGGEAGEQALARLVACFAPGNQLRFQESQSRGEIARGLLAPWIESEQEPTESVRRGVQAFLLKYVGDPRIHPARWSDAGDQATSLMRRWLTRASLSAFFELIRDHALDSHWRYREAFWTACLDKDETADAWLVFGRNIHASARAIRELNGSYGRLEGSGVSGDHAVMLLKIKNLIFCEWSHNGKLRVWSGDWKDAPRLNLPSYTRADLTANGLPFPPNSRFGSKGAGDGGGLSHIGSDRSYWQGSAAELLARRARISLGPADWLPR
ncbi:EH signature domain-containing protein [Rhodoplanes sp. Z2-YC6860]|uniref:EH signature domain-containing protein n=1 Tax=Rhodoplanes sp. Z2-YC6860 TaxID=674703 RepID=UPI00078B5984|nr:EH signature domain-containing protein [Rhodoplanes sp. Z2-YC6860]AMN39055.1 hypothetical protein RHPLAN_05900 [Rhodoplanes sp. Z2-YC6860]